MIKIFILSSILFTFLCMVGFVLEDINEIKEWKVYDSFEILILFKDAVVIGVVLGMLCSISSPFLLVNI